MSILKKLLFLSVGVLFVGCGSNLDESTSCQGKDQCENDSNCRCWCSQICNWRKKTSEDHPVFIEKDPNGKFCYCKQWDYDHYEDNCIKGLKIKEPKGAK